MTVTLQSSFSNVFRNDEKSQLPYVLLILAIGLSTQITLNKTKVKQPSHTASFERASHYAVLFILIVANMVLDTLYSDISFMFVNIKGILVGYYIGLLDFYFSPVKMVSVTESMVGLVAWLVPYGIASVWCEYLFGEVITIMTFPKISLLYPLWMYARLTLFMVLAAPLGEVFFNPLHRLQHASSSYVSSHKVHHKFTNDLCGLVFFSGTLFDDMLMSVSLCGSLVINVSLFYYSGFLQGYLCTPLMYTMWALSTYAHSHNEGLANLFLPIPEGKNFILYHRQHHLDPASNMGLCREGDMFWDWILGQRTVTKIAKGE
eukprot:TRINITY_DN3958_c1_g1_i1.p1 TRINITY_DN3958_c1_g1~~TRINITY_DN3958_c1_g1_i1.p1  ORF type:complete len:340 (+),score=6.35 TRINITY_DN3958_c1_g1_i1:69-1022(+)